MGKLPPIKRFECTECQYSDYRMSARKVGEIIPGGCPRCGGSFKVVAEEAPDWLVRMLEQVTKKFEILDMVGRRDRIEMEVSSRNPRSGFRYLLRVLKKENYLPVMRVQEGELKLALVRSPPVRGGSPVVNLALFAATVASTFVAGYYLFESSLGSAALFSASLLAMLVAHEMGHKLSAWHNRVASTLPYFIPAPPPFPLGTFGAVINIKSPIPTKEALVEMGASGPITGFVLSAIITFIGLSLSTPSSLENPLPFVPVMFGLLQLVTLGRFTSAFELNPLTFSGWVVMLLTMFNMIPVGQLDGGHIARALLGGQRHYILTRMLGFLLMLLGLAFPEMPIFFVWGLLILVFFRGYHPGALDDVSPLSTRHKILAAAALVVFVLCLPLPVA
ncbi:MAG: site-2 protease family protein [Candidatus Hadarchaeum sp.]|uniref:site-2 protease family protein n=1 Tax=Candidatus Hadarchaeum sp. TaxID=2883567 RepID=UPI003D0E77D7